MIPPLLRNPRYHALDLWRGVACLLVVGHHAGFALIFDPTDGPGLEARLRRMVVFAFARMNLGVALFFVISGYCIAASVDAHRRRGVGALAFLSRRIWRIYPPYWAAVLWFLAATAGLDALGLNRLHYGEGRYALQLDSPGALDATQWAGNLTLTEEWRPLVWRPPDAKVYTRVAWSLCYEEQFYFVCFLALVALPSRLAGVLAAVTVGSLGLRLAAADVGRYHLIAGSFPTLWHEFAVGLAVYWRLNVAGEAPGRRAVEVGLLGLAALGGTGRLSTPVSFSTLTAAVFGLVLIATRPWDEAALRARWLEPLRACGRRCYSIYLVHLPVCTVGCLWLHERGIVGFWGRALIIIPAVVIAALAFSWLFFFAVERHFLNPPIVRRDQGGAAPSIGPSAGERPEAGGRA